MVSKWEEILRQKTIAKNNAIRVKYYERPYNYLDIKRQVRLQILKELLTYDFTDREIAGILCITERSLYTLKKILKKEGYE
jgi:hypothetical protein